MKGYFSRKIFSLQKALLFVKQRGLALKADASPLKIYVF
jgi:hypothetical protein